MSQTRPKACMAAMLAFLGLAFVMGRGLAGAQSLDIPSKRWGLSFGNSSEFTGLRFNFRDSRVKRITGVNVTLWGPRQDNEEAVVTGLSFGLLPGGAHLRGVQIGLLGIVGMKSITGVSIAPLGLGAAENVIGINLAGLGLGAGESIVGISLAGLGLGAGKDVRGITVGGLGVGAGERMIGLNVGGIGLGAGKKLVGINVAGVGAGAGDLLAGLTISGLAAGSTEVRGLTIAGAAVGGQNLVGLHVAGGVVHVVKDGFLRGCAVSPFNYVRGTQIGLTIGIVNYARTVRGVQLGLVNIVRDNPRGLKVLPVFNTSF